MRLCVVLGMGRARLVVWTRAPRQEEQAPRGKGGRAHVRACPSPRARAAAARPADVVPACVTRFTLFLLKMGARGVFQWEKPWFPSPSLYARVSTHAPSSPLLPLSLLLLAADGCTTPCPPHTLPAPTEPTHPMGVGTSSPGNAASPEPTNLPAPQPAAERSITL